MSFKLRRLTIAPVENPATSKVVFTVHCNLPICSGIIVGVRVHLVIAPRSIAVAGQTKSQHFIYSAVSVERYSPDMLRVYLPTTFHHAL